MLRFAFQAAGLFAVIAAIFVLLSHSSPNMDFLHAAGASGGQPKFAGFLAHLAGSIMLGGIGYLLFSIGKSR